jgi:TIR domain-containing protein
MTESRDVFFCYAHKDKEAVVRPLAEALKASGFTYWLDEEEILWGHPVREKIEEGISNSRFAVVVISSNSIDKPWPTAEINAALSLALEREPSSATDRILPLLVGGVEERKKFRGKMLFLASMYYLKWNDDPEPIVQALRRRMKSVGAVSPSGFVSREEIRASRKKLPGEVFAIELLEDPIELERDSGGITITVDRRNVTHCVIDNEGKRKLSKDCATPASTLDTEDRKIQRFLTEEIAGKLTINPRELGVRFRWASGGVLSIVRFKGREWVPLFFRDIPPYGWNISLGSTERRFDPKGRLSDGEAEHRHPWDFILREFLEESMVISRRPDLEDPLGARAFRAFTTGESLPGYIIERWEDHAALRLTCDHFASRLDGPQIELKRVDRKTWMTLKIRSSRLGGKGWDPESDLVSKEPNVLVCFSVRDFGIEVVKVFSYELQDSDYLLDGEIDHEHCLVRMPMALFSCDYLARIFSYDENWYHYSTRFGEPPSIEVSDAPAGMDVVFFPWDVEQRMKIINGEMGTDHERERFKDWHKRFGESFLDDDGRPSLANPSRLFVPGTAKILNLYFSRLSQ